MRGTPGAGQGVRTAARVENLALVPASLLPHKATYQRLANQLPPGAVLIVLPTEDTAERRTLQTAAVQLRAKGHPVTTLSVAEVLTLLPGRRARAPVDTPPPPPVPAGPAHGAPGPVPPPTPLLSPPDAAPPAPAVSPPTDPPVVPPFTRELRLVQLAAGRTRVRFYLFQWHPSLWGGWVLVGIWGRLGDHGRLQTVLEREAPTLDAAVTRLVRQRLRQGYVVADWQ